MLPRRVQAGDPPGLLGAEENILQRETEGVVDREVILLDFVRQIGWDAHTGLSPAPERAAEAPSKSDDFHISPFGCFSRQQHVASVA